MKQILTELAQIEPGHTLMSLGLSTNLSLSGSSASADATTAGCALTSYEKSNFTKLNGLRQQLNKCIYQQQRYIDKTRRLDHFLNEIMCNIAELLLKNRELALIFK